MRPGIAVFAALALVLPGRVLAAQTDQQIAAQQAAIVDQLPPVKILQLNVDLRPPPTMRFLLLQGLTSLGIQAACAGATAGLVALVSSHLSATDVTSNAFILIATAIPTTLAYILVPSIVLTKMAGRPLSSVYFQKVFWASGLASTTWTLSILATDTTHGGSTALALSFGIVGMVLTAAFQVWMGYMDWDTDQPSPPAPVADVRPTRTMPDVPGISLLSWQF